MPDDTADAGSKLLAIYLNDHLIGATGGVELARRLAGVVKSDPLPALVREIEEDRGSLLVAMRKLGVRPDPVKVAAGWVGEKVSRLKLNGRLFDRSPLSTIVEVEGLMLGVRGKAAGWRTLRALAEHDDRLDRAEFDRLIERADRQIETLESVRVAAVAKVLVQPAVR